MVRAVSVNRTSACGIASITTPAELSAGSGSSSHAETSVASGQAPRLRGAEKVEVQKEDGVRHFTSDLAV